MKYKENKTYKDKDATGVVMNDYEFEDCVFENCKFNSTEFNSCQFTNCEFKNCSLVNPIFHNTEFRNMIFRATILFGINWFDLVGREGMHPSIPVDIFTNCTFKYNTFPQLSLLKMNFDSSSFFDCEFTECNLKESSFKSTKFEKTPFLKCDLTKANFSNATGYYVDLKSCIVKAAKFTFPEAISLLSSLDMIIE